MIFVLTRAASIHMKKNGDKKRTELHSAAPEPIEAAQHTNTKQMLALLQLLRPYFIFIFRIVWYAHSTFPYCFSVIVHPS